MERVAVKAILKAGGNARDNFFSQHEVTLKTPRDLVTEVDLENEKMIISMIRENFPEHEIIGEESGKSEGSVYTWFVDPVDGTTNYSIHNPFFDISIGVAKGNDPVMAFIYAPMTNELFTAQKGKGAFMNDRRIRVSGTEKLGDSLVTYCHDNTERQIKRVTRVFAELKPVSRDLTRMRAGGLELAYVAAGRVEAYVSNGIKPWDVVAGVLLVREAGGKVTDFHGNRWDLTKSDMIASNARVGGEIVKHLKKI
jgi:myo-inositol-1(or 4)-monophosphatase